MFVLLLVTTKILAIKLGTSIDPSLFVPTNSMVWLEQSTSLIYLWTRLKNLARETMEQHALKM